ncbi:hypothetical protein [Elstera litoralis]|uniref:hypothetical protein n=1 Tax=Elstera litoralis TaxID=552518 RepID=UPI0012ED892E|nr:hypothetical protein [Elstera litoralis]
MDFIAKSIFEGIRKANESYYNWSGGEYWLSDAPVENIMQTYVAESCYKAVKAKKLLVHPEANLNYFLHQKLWGKRRADIIITDDEQEPLYIIELKRSSGEMMRDAIKINDIFLRFRKKHPGKIKSAYWGAFVTHHSDMRNHQNIDMAVNHVFENFSSCLKCEPSRISRLDKKITNGDVWYNDHRVDWNSAALIVKIDFS